MRLERPHSYVKVPVGYRCPLCSSCVAPKEMFRASELAGTPICEGCSFELSHFLELDARENDSVLDRLEALTGLSFIECRRRYYQEAIAQFRYMLDSRNVDREVAAETFFTRRSRDETVAHWQSVLEDYLEALRLLDKQA